MSNMIGKLWKKSRSGHGQLLQHFEEDVTRRDDATQLLQGDFDLPNARPMSRGENEVTISGPMYYLLMEKAAFYNKYKKLAPLIDAAVDDSQYSSVSELAEKRDDNRMVIMSQTEYEDWEKRRDGMPTADKSESLIRLAHTLNELSMTTKRLELRHDVKMDTGIRQQAALDQLTFELTHEQISPPAAIRRVQTQVAVMTRRMIALLAQAEEGAVPLCKHVLKLGVDIAGENGILAKADAELTLLDVLKGYTLSSLLDDTRDAHYNSGAGPINTLVLARSTWARCGFLLRGQLGDQPQSDGNQPAGLQRTWIQCSNHDNFHRAQLTLAHHLREEARKAQARSSCCQDSIPPAWKAFKKPAVVTIGPVKSTVKAPARTPQQPPLRTGTTTTAAKVRNPSLRAPSTPSSSSSSRSPLSPPPAPRATRPSRSSVSPPTTIARKPVTRTATGGSLSAAPKKSSKETAQDTSPEPGPSNPRRRVSRTSSSSRSKSDGRSVSPPHPSGRTVGEKSARSGK